MMITDDQAIQFIIFLCQSIRDCLMLIYFVATGIKIMNFFLIGL